MSKVMPSRRSPAYVVKAVSDNEAVLTVKGWSGPYQIHYWRPLAGGYVYDVTRSPGTSGQQVCEGLEGFGNTLRCAAEQSLADLIRRHARSTKGRAMIESHR